MMDSVRNPVNNVRALLSSSKTEVLLLSLSVLFFIFSLVMYVFISHKLSSNDKDSIVIEKNSESKKGSKKIIIDVGGSVERPGVYELVIGSRVRDAIISANGISASADRQYIASVLNGARILEDGEKIFIPSTVDSNSNGAMAEQNNVLGSNITMININTASMEQLDTLSGIGEKTAQKIISGRPYGRIIDLRERKIVGQAVYEKIKDTITAY